MNDSSLNRYLDEIGRSELLSDAQEQELSLRIQAGDQRALNKLVSANLRFVVKIATQYRGRGVELDDLISEGNIGLMKAAAKFDASRGVRFVNFAVVYIREQIEKTLPDTVDTKENTPTRRPAVAVGVSDASLDAPLGHRTNMSLLSVLVNKDAPLADERIHSEAIEEAVEFALGALTPREARVVNGFFGINQEHETLAEIAEDMGLKRERVRQIRNRAVRRLRKAYRHALTSLRQS